MWNLFSKDNKDKSAAAPALAPVVHELTPQISLAETRFPVLGKQQNHTLLARLKWVMHGDRIGIIHELDAAGFAVVHYVDKTTGQTVAACKVRCGELRLARFHEIPECRVVGMSPMYAATLGYF